jgi:hypothetical protein
MRKVIEIESIKNAYLSLSLSYLQWMSGRLVFVISRWLLTCEAFIPLALDILYDFRKGSVSPLVSS